MNSHLTREMYFPVNRREVLSSPLIVFSSGGQTREIMYPEDLPADIAEWPETERLPFGEHGFPEVPLGTPIACLPVDWPTIEPIRPITVGEALGLVADLA